MKLSTYMENGPYTVSELAQKCGVTRATIYRILNGNEITLTLAHKIFIATKGKVTFLDLVIPDKEVWRKPKKVEAKGIEA